MDEKHFYQDFISFCIDNGHIFKISSHLSIFDKNIVFLPENLIKWLIFPQKWYFSGELCEL